jgi:hypothetical protein
MRHFLLFRNFFLALLVFVLSACSHPVRPTPFDIVAAPDYHNSSLEIGFVRGQNSYLISATPTRDTKEVIAQAFTDRDLVKERAVAFDRYVELFRKVDTVVANHQGVDPTQPCRTPYEIKVRLENSSKTIAGCRVSEKDTRLSTLIFDAERLLMEQ